MDLSSIKKGVPLTVGAGANPKYPYLGDGWLVGQPKGWYHGKKGFVLQNVSKDIFFTFFRRYMSLYS